MTFAFTVRAPERVPRTIGERPLTFGELQRAVAGRIETVERVGPERGIAGRLHVYRPGVTTRAVEIEAGEAEVGVSVFTVASIEDHRLAVDLVEAIAAHRGAATVETEDDEAVPVADLRQRYGDAWAVRQLAFGVRVLSRLVDEKPGGVVSLQGPIRSFLLGARLMAELRTAGPEEALGDRLVTAMRRTQWPPECFAASVMEVTGGPSERRIRLAVLTGRTRTLLPDVEAVALQEPGGGLMYVPPADIVESLPDHASYLDERHVLVDAVPPDRWAELLRGATTRAADLDQL